MLLGKFYIYQKGQSIFRFSKYFFNNVLKIEQNTIYPS